MGCHKNDTRRSCKNDSGGRWLGLSCICVRLGSPEFSQDPVTRECRQYGDLILGAEAPPRSVAVARMGISPRNVAQLFSKCVDVPNVTFAVRTLACSPVESFLLLLLSPQPLLHLPPPLSSNAISSCNTGGLADCQWEQQAPRRCDGLHCRGCCRLRAGEWDCVCRPAEQAAGNCLGGGWDDTNSCDCVRRGQQRASCELRRWPVGFLAGDKCLLCGHCAMVGSLVEYHWAPRDFSPR